MVKSEKIYSAQSYLDLVTGLCYEIYGDNDIIFIEDALQENGLCLWNYPLSEIDHIVENKLNVVLVDCMVWNEKEGEFEHEYRWFEVEHGDSEEKEPEKKVSAESIAINAIEHSIFCDSEILTEYYGSADEYFSKQFDCTVDEAEKILNCKFAIRDRWPEDEDSYWFEIRTTYFDEDEQKTYVDAWISDDNWERGKVIAKIDTNENVEYLDERAKTDSYAQEVISEAVVAIKKEKEEEK